MTTDIPKGGSFVSSFSLGWHLDMSTEALSALQEYGVLSSGPPGVKISQPGSLGVGSGGMVQPWARCGQCEEVWAVHTTKMLQPQQLEKDL